MNKKNRALITAMLDREINLVEFSKQFPEGTFQYSKAIIQFLEIAFKEKDANKIDLLLYAAVHDGIKKSYLEIFNKLIVESWHFKHEDLARYLKEIKSEESVDFLYKACFHNFSWDFENEVARKSIKALKAIGNSPAIEKLKLLAKNKDEKIRGYAMKEVDRLEK